MWWMIDGEKWCPEFPNGYMENDSMPLRSGRTSYFNHTHLLLRNVRRILWIGEMVDFNLNLGSIMLAYVWYFCSTIHVFLAHNEGWFINGKGLPFLSYVLLAQIHSVIPLLFRLESMYNYELFMPCLHFIGCSRKARGACLHSENHSGELTMTMGVSSLYGYGYGYNCILVYMLCYH